VAGLAFSAYGAYSQSVATRNAYEYQAKVAANNAQIAKWQSEDAIARGQKEEETHRLKVAHLMSSQRASMAARGLSLDYGSPLDILTGTEFMGEIDALAIRDNAARDAWAYRNKGAEYDANSTLLENRADSESPWLSAGGTLLTQGGAVAEKWYKPSTKMTIGG
jgi:hypothetical protein